MLSCSGDEWDGGGLQRDPDHAGPNVVRIPSMFTTAQIYLFSYFFSFICDFQISPLCWKYYFVGQIMYKAEDKWCLLRNANRTIIAFTCVHNLQKKCMGE